MLDSKRVLKALISAFTLINLGRKSRLNPSEQSKETIMMRAEISEIENGNNEAKS